MGLLKKFEDNCKSFFFPTGDRSRKCGCWRRNYVRRDIVESCVPSHSVARKTTLCHSHRDNRGRHCGTRARWCTTRSGRRYSWMAEVDAGFEDLLNPGNLSNEGGNLVFEIVCEFKVTQADAKPACNNFTNSIKIPPVGSHVQIVGSYVRDTNHAQWMEIHPVTSIKVIP